MKGGRCQSPIEGHRSGDRFDLTVDWHRLLTDHGWRLVKTVNAVEYWARPGKTKGYNATLNYRGDNRLHVFSTDAQPFEAGRSYGPFSAKALLEFGADFAKVAQVLRNFGAARRPSR